MKKAAVVLFINILLIAVIVIAADLISSYKAYKENVKFVENSIIGSHEKAGEKDNYIPRFDWSLKMQPFSKFWNKERKNFNSLRRYIEGSDKNKKSIILFGCSFVEGDFLEPEETFGYKLAKLTGRTVYNRGFSGSGPEVMLWQTRNNKFYDDINKEPEYAVFVYINDHLRRIYFNTYGLDLRVYAGYKKNGNSLIEYVPKDIQMHRFNFMRKRTEERLYSSNLLKNEYKDKHFNFLKLHLEETRKELQKRYPNIKFIIIKYPQKLLREGMVLDTVKYAFYTDRWKELEDEGFIIYDLDKKLNVDITNDEYSLPDQHPNEKAWDVITEQLVKDFNL